MRYELKDYQRDAAITLVDRLRVGRELWTSSKMSSSFALSAITGAGKTVIAAAVIEALIHGSSDLDAEPDPRAAFLWITDDPALNRQTRGKMLDASDLLLPMNLMEVDDGFLESDLLPRRVYFLNTQKLSKSSRLVQSGTNQRQFSFWEVLANTINGGKAHLYLILDEAHRGMKRAVDRTTIVQRLIQGEKGSNPAVPVAWGISATIDRFSKAMGEARDRTAFPHVVVDIDKVRASGLVKDTIGLDQPDEEGTFSTTLLRDAVKTTRDFESRWAAYCIEAGEPPVLPALVIQVPDKSDKSKIGEIVQAIESEWPGLGLGAIAHVFGEDEPIILGSRTIRWVYPESIQADAEIRVVLAKEAISTGWDCPRAEVLYSERPAKDATHIAQVIGRMVAYQDESGKWSSLQSDFVIVSRRDDGSLAASIVDPHGDHLADAKAKLRALADFAEQYGSRFLRIESVAKVPDGSLRSLDLQDENVRKAVRDFEGGKVSPLYSSSHAFPYGS